MAKHTKRKRKANTLKSLQRTLKWAREVKGLTCGSVERFAGGYKIDLFGFIDAIGISEVYGTVALQACGHSDFQAHVQKITIDCRKVAILWLEASRQNRIWLVGWRRVKIKRGGKKFIYRERFLEITLDIFDEGCIFS